ncbi:hypothetical protein TcBrA4_0048130 [Trypanosoma cruzi]|nr:hypothetical protein TcBrA4_0048130 [Trypanosoma cruzi]
MRADTCAEEADNEKLTEELAQREVTILAQRRLTMREELAQRG